MKRYHYAIKAITDEMFRETGKLATKYVEKGHDPTQSVRESKVRNLKKAIEILEKDPTNVHI